MGITRSAHVQHLNQGNTPSNAFICVLFTFKCCSGLPHPESIEWTCGFTLCLFIYLYVDIYLFIYLLICSGSICWAIHQRKYENEEQVPAGERAIEDGPS
jgi:hypothetical protein